MFGELGTLGEAQASGLILSGAVFFTFVFVFLLAFAVAQLAQRRMEIKRRAVISRVMASDVGGYTDHTDDAGKRQSLRYQSLSDVSATLAKASKTAVDERGDIPKTQIELIKAGFFSESAPGYYQLARIGLALFAPIVFYLAVEFLASGMKSSTVLLSALSISAVGFLLPSVYIARAQKHLREQCAAGFPDFMDLLVVCTQAGMSPRAAIDRVGRELVHTYPYLGANLYLLSLELRAGRSLAEAINNFAHRVDLDEAYSLGALLQQTEQLGTSISDALHVYSDEMRDKRLSRAEEKAHALPVKLVIPLGIYVFPVMLVVIMLPVALRINSSLF